MLGLNFHLERKTKKPLTAKHVPPPAFTQEQSRKGNIKFSTSCTKTSGKLGTYTPIDLNVY